MPPEPAARPTSYLLVGPPDLLHDLIHDFADVGWRASASRWQAVVTAPPEDAGAPEPGWPTEVTLAEVRHDGHDAACREFLYRPPGGAGTSGA